MARQISNANAAAPSAARANSQKGYSSNLATNPAASQDKARPNLLNRDAEIGRAYDGVDENKTHDCP
jgi:hypothetical protein